jgi:two-component system, LytTR family, response regulator LytT
MTILILEDEKLAAEKLEKLILEIDGTSKIIGKLPSITSAIDWLTSHNPPDLILSDIRLLDGLCFEIFEKVKVETPVIFTTAYDQYAIKAFEVNSIDYLLKPVQKEKLKNSFDKLKARSKTSLTPAPDFHAVLKYLTETRPEYKSRFMVRSGQKIAAIPTGKIAYFYSENKLTYIVTKDNKRYFHDQPLEELMDVLDPRMFFRINRQYIITFESIAEIHPYFKGRVKLILSPKDENEVIISAERTPDFKKWIDQ